MSRLDHGRPSNAPATIALKPREDDDPVELLVAEASAAQRSADHSRALSLYLEAASHTEVAPADLALKIARCYDRLDAAGEAFQWLARVVDSADEFRAWNAAAAALARLKNTARPSARRQCRVAITGSYTLSQLAAMLPLAALRLGVDLTVHEGLYGQYQQDLLDSGSALYRGHPDHIVIAVHEGVLQLDPAAESTEAAVRAEAARWGAIWARAGNCSDATVVQHNFAPRPESEFGNLSAAVPESRYAMVHALNALLSRSAPDHVSIVDCDRIAANFGRERWFDDRYWFRSKQAVALEALPLVSRHTAAVIAARLGLQRKCLVLDLDNTLWGGVIGEDGLDGIAVGGDGEGEAFAAFQEYCLALKERGVILAVASKNNERDAREVFERHPEMRMRLDDFAMFAVNWDDKPTNLRRIARSLGIGLDSLVLADDNPAERQIVRRLLPEVDVIALPGEPAGYRRTLSSYLGFESAAITVEDRRRTEQYRARAEAAELASSAADIDSFLRDLRMQAVVAPFDDLHLPRVAQLCGKTNQFNLTTRRHTETALRWFMQSPSHVTRYLKLSDRFTDHGLVAVAIAEIRGEVLEIDSFLISCRVIGRTVESALMADLCCAAQAAGCTTLRGTYVPTAKNTIVSDLYPGFHFSLVSELDDGSMCWKYDLAACGPIVNDLVASTP
jgi:FkbH-like protein